MSRASESGDLHFNFCSKDLTGGELRPRGAGRAVALFFFPKEEAFFFLLFG